MSSSARLSGLRRRQLIAGVGALSVGSLAAPHIARAAARSLRIGLAPSVTSTVGRGATAFAAAVARHPALSVLKVEVLDNSQAGDDPTMLRNCMEGTLDCVVQSSLFISTPVAEVGVLGIPYLFRDQAVARRVLDGPLGTELRAVATGKGVPVLAWGEQGMRHITANKPVHEPTDLKGLHIRVTLSELVMKGFRALGADPAPLPFNLLREALRSGEFQAQENPVGNIAGLRLNEVQSHLNLTGHNFDVVGFVASPDLVEDLTAPQQQGLVECAQAAAAVMRRVSDESDRDGLAQLKAAGMVVVQPDRAAMAAAARPYQDSLAETFGAERIRALIALNA